MFYKVITLLVLLAVSAMAHDREHYEKKFFDWMTEHQQNYEDGAEFLRRLEIFIGWDKLIEEHNASGSTWKMAHNQFSGMSHAEFMERYLSPVPRSMLKRGTAVYSASEEEVKATPSAWDWTAQGGVTNVKDQGSCGSCWTFSTTGALESAYFNKYGNLVSFSEQELVSCAGFPNMGCNGGQMDAAFNWIKRNGGLCSEEDYPYTSGAGDRGTCNSSSCSSVTGSTVTSYTDVQSDSESSLQSAVYQQTVSVAIEADQLGFQLYSSGVYTGECGTNLDHGVLAVGYGTDNGVDYWKVKNSWSSSWGEDGYIRMEKGKNQQGGQCGILLMASYPSL
jgi:C1A family cysteine protease